MMGFQKIFILFATMVLCGVLGCSKPSVPVGKNIVQVNFGECTPVSSHVSICFDSLVSDGRCPVDVNCVWSGNATIKVSVAEGSTTHRFFMSVYGRTGPDAIEAFAKDTTIAGYTITFEDLLPHPRSRGSAPSARRLAIFRIE